MQSMTGFCRLESPHSSGLVVWEIRSVNHRYLDLNFRMPEEFRMLELQLRKLAQTLLQRGKVDCTLRYNVMASEQVDLNVDERLLSAVLQKVDLLEKQRKNLRSVSALELLQWPGIVTQQIPDQSALNRCVLDGFQQALSQLNDSRRQEGERIADMLVSRCEKLQQLVCRVRERRSQVNVEIRNKLTARLDELSVEVDRQRFEQELVYLAQKMDVEEELDRLDSHITEVGSVLQQSKPVGRRLDFLMQEFNREANTLSSKSADIETTQAAIDMKVLIEQMREQVQNVE